ncbi:MAG: hypothetical protein IRY97_01500, partial [Thermomicrobiaceae bacterium]|nr:hypothetical protein [Thermomicrobiaceae bacterium]
MPTRRADRRLRAPRNGWLVGLGIVMILGLFLVSTNASALYATTPAITSLTPPATLHIADESPAGFDIPYIQVSTTLTVAVGATGVPSGGGVEIVVDGASTYDMAAPYQAQITVRPGEHRVEAYLVRSDRTRLTNPEAHVVRGPIGVGAIYTTIGDSITAGMYGDRSVSAVEGCADSPHSADCRNFYQHNPSDGVWYRGYQVRLNDCLTGATGAATFLMNEGVGGLTSAQILSRMPSYRARVQRLGVSGA